MSDVWQGPGWWLASDGKWYPADAEPGAVYEGKLQNDSSTIGDVDPPAPEPVAPEPDPVASEPDPVAPEPEPALPEPEPVEPPLQEPAPQPVDSFDDQTDQSDIPSETAQPSDVSLGADPFARMPAPIVEEPRVGGWQSIDPTPTPVAPLEPIATPSVDPQPTDASRTTDDDPQSSAVENDGWTSAYEERHDVPDVNAPVAAAAPSASAPEIPVPEVQIPEVQIPDVQIPDVQIPDVEAPPVQQIPDVQIPDIQAPPVQQIPDVQIPDVHTPEPPVDPLPPVEVPPVAVPDAAMPAAEAPVPPSVQTPVPPVPQTFITPDDADATVVREAIIPIERDDAWRKPSTSDESTSRPITPTPSGPSGVPDVVDLAIPEDPPPFVPEAQGRKWGVVGAAIIGLVVMAALAWLITSLFNGNDDVSTTEPSGSTVTQPDDQDGAQTSTSDASAPSTSSGDEDTEQNQDVSVFALRAGDCIVGDIGAGQVTKVSKVDCEEEHQFEVYREALIESSITSFDEEAISAYAEEVCRTSLEAYIPADDDRGLKFKFLQPTEDSWNQTEDPDRVITCLLFDDDAPLVGRAGP